MSRTIRRKNSHDIHWHTTDREINEEGIWGRVPKPPKELAKALARYHSDGVEGYSPSAWFRNQEHVKMRTLVNGELARFWKDPEYEIQIERRKLHDWWD